MAIAYRVIDVYISEEARFKGHPLAETLLDYVRNLKTAARCMVHRGIAGVYENGETTSHKILDLSFNLPVKVEIVLPASEAEPVLADLQNMVSEGIVGMRDLLVCSHRTRRHLFPRQIRVRDVMTPSPACAPLDETLDRVVRILLSADFTGLPVVDGEMRPVGVISQGDLIYRGKMPVRLALMARSGPKRLAGALETLSRKTAQDIMSRPAVCIPESALLTEAVRVMLDRRVKRLPAVDAEGRLSGMLSRMDIFQTITRQAPDWEAIRRFNIQIAAHCRVCEIMRRDTHTVSPETPVMEVLRIIDTSDIQRVAVVDGGGRLLGLISDHDLLTAFEGEHPDIWGLMSRLIPFAQRTSQAGNWAEKPGRALARDIMKTDLITIRDDAAIEDAISLMTDKRLKRLPVVDDAGLFKGMISRESLLHAGFREWSSEGRP